MDGRTGLQFQIHWPALQLVLGVLLLGDAVDAALFIGHLLAHQDAGPRWLRHPTFNMNREFGVGESFEYVKSAATAVALVLCARVRRAGIFAILAGVHLWFLLDNAFALHEWIGGVLGKRVLLERSFGLERPTDAGQVLFGAGLGVLLLVAFAYAIGRERPALRATAVLLAAAALLPGVFGVLVDAAHATALRDLLGDPVLILAEDGGETAALSLNCALAVGCAAFALSGGVGRAADAYREAPGGPRVPGPS